MSALWCLHSQIDGELLPESAGCQVVVMRGREARALLGDLNMLASLPTSMAYFSAGACSGLACAVSCGWRAVACRWLLCGWLFATVTLNALCTAQRMLTTVQVVDLLHKSLKGVQMCLCLIPSVCAPVFACS